MDSAGQENGGVRPARREFLNSYTHFLDPKRRLTIPSEWREPFAGTPTLYVIPDFFERCLRLIPDVDMERRLEKVRQIPISDRRGRDFVRELGRQSDKVQWDAQGRIRIKEEMLNWAGLVDQVILIGSVDTFELWEPKNLGQISRVSGVDQDKLREAAPFVGF
jgi:MraZ protein